MKRVFLFPTEHEAEKFRAAAPDAEVRISGVGASETAAATAKALRDGYKHLVLAGIAGTYDDTVEAGATFAVSEERMAGLPDDFARFYTASATPRGIPTAVSNTVSHTGAEPRGAQLENMEGAVFFAMCQDAGVRYCEIRSVSNRVGAPREQWLTDTAIENLTRTLVKTFIKKGFMNKTKLILYVAVAVIIIAAVILLLNNLEFFMSKVLTWIIVILVSFLAGWLIGRFGGKKKKSLPEKN